MSAGYFSQFLPKQEEHPFAKFAPLPSAYSPPKFTNGGWGWQPSSDFEDYDAASNGSDKLVIDENPPEAPKPKKKNAEPLALRRLKCTWEKSQPYVGRYYLCPDINYNKKIYKE